MSLKFRNPAPETFVNTLVYAGPKVGKSTLAASGVPGVLYMNCDLENALTFAKSRHPDGSIMDVDYSGGTYATMIDIATAVQDPAQDIARTVVVDPIGELYRLLLEEISNRAVRASLPQRGDVSVHIERFCRALCEAPIHTVLVCHEMQVKDEGSGEVERLPYTGTSNPTLGQKLMGMVDVIAYPGVVQRPGGEREFRAQLVPGGGRRGGDRFNVLAEEDGCRASDLGEWITTIQNNKPAQPVEQEKIAA